jgi:hypothetical protein
VSDNRDAGATPCVSTVAPWEAFCFGRGGTAGVVAGAVRGGLFAPAFPFLLVAAGRHWAQALAQQSGNPKDKGSLPATLPRLNAETAVGTVDFIGGPVPSCAVRGLAGGEWSRSGGALPYQLDHGQGGDRTGPDPT